MSPNFRTSSGRTILRDRSSSPYTNQGLRLPRPPLALWITYHLREFSKKDEKLSRSHSRRILKRGRTRVSTDEPSMRAEFEGLVEVFDAFSRFEDMNFSPPIDRLSKPLLIVSLIRVRRHERPRDTQIAISESMVRRRYSSQVWSQSDLPQIPLSAQEVNDYFSLFNHHPSREHQTRCLLSNLSQDSKLPYEENSNVGG